MAACMWSDPEAAVADPKTSTKRCTAGQARAWGLCMSTSTSALQSSPLLIRPHKTVLEVSDTPPAFRLSKPAHRPWKALVRLGDGGGGSVYGDNLPMPLTSGGIEELRCVTTWCVKSPGSVLSQGMHSREVGTNASCKILERGVGKKG